MNTETPHNHITHAQRHPSAAYKVAPQQMADELLADLTHIYRFKDGDLAVSAGRQKRFNTKVENFLYSDTWTKKRDDAMAYSDLPANKAPEIDAAAAEIMKSFRSGLKIRKHVMERHTRHIHPEHDVRYYGNGWNKYYLSNTYLSHLVNHGLDQFMECGLTERSALSTLGAVVTKTVDIYSSVQPHVYINTASCQIKQHIPPLQDAYMSADRRIHEIRTHAQTLTQKLETEKQPGHSHACP